GNFLLRQEHLATITERNEARLARDQEKKAREAAEAAMREATNVTGFMVNDIFAQADPLIGKYQITLKEALDRALPRVSETFADQPLVEMKIRSAVGTAYRIMGAHHDAAVHMKRAQELAEQLLPPDHPNRLQVELNCILLQLRDGHDTEAAAAYQ